jgi:hypothetical protein
LKSKLKGKVNLDNSKPDSLLRDDFNDNRSYKKEISHYITGIDENLFHIDEMNSGIKLKVDNNTSITHENVNNIRISLLHAFFFMMAFSIILPTNIVLVGALGWDYTTTGLVLAFTPFGNLFSTYISNRVIEKTYKKPLIIGVFLVIVSSLMYILSYPSESIVLLCFSRFVLGLGSAQLVNKHYILHFVPRKRINVYLLYLQIASLSGLSVGPLLNMIIFLISEAILGDKVGYDWFNIMVNPQWFVMLFGVVLMFLILKFYTEPTLGTFVIAKEKVVESNPASLNKEIISREERIMIDKLDDILKKINEKHQFSDTNLVARNIEQIAWKENKTNSYIYKCFVVFISILIIVRVSI